MEDSCFLTDIYLPQMLYVLTIRSPVAKGRLKAIECPMLPVGCTLISAQDIPGKNRIEGCDLPVLADGELSYIGEPVALLLGPDKNALENCIRNCKVIFEEDVPVFSVYDKTDAMIAAQRTICAGDPDEAFANAANVIRNSYSTGIQEHWYAEPTGAIAWLEGKKNDQLKKDMNLMVRTATQAAFHVKQSVTQVLGTSPQNVQVDPTITGIHMDGRFWFPSLVACHAALGAWITKKPVRLILTREEDFAFSPKRCGTEIAIASALDEKGDITAVEINTTVNVGAYGVNAAEMLEHVNLGSLGVYKTKNIRLSGYAVKTNIPPQGPFAGFGLAQGFFAMERHVTNIADQCKQNPAQWRKEHFAKNGLLPPGLPIKNAPAGDLLIDTVVTMSDYSRKWASYELLRHSRKQGPSMNEHLRGIGIALGYQGNGLLYPGRERNSTMELTLEKDGSLEIKTSMTCAGSHFTAVWKHIAEEVLGVNADMVRISSGTGYPDSGPAVMSRNVTILAKLVEQSCIAIRKLRFRDPLPITVRKAIRPQKNSTWEQFFPTDSSRPFLDCNGFVQPGWASAVVEVEIDLIEYTPRIRGVWMIVDGGKIISEGLARKSLKTAVVQSLGWAYREQINYINGTLSADQFENFEIPGTVEIPAITIEFITPNGGDPKGVGDLPFSCVPAAYTQAVSQAMDYHFHSIPLKSLDIWYASKKKTNSEEPA